MNIVIADDHDVVRKGVKQILGDIIGDGEIGEARTISELMLLLDKQSWDVVLLDISMPDKSGLQALNSIKEGWPTVPVLILSIHPEEHYALRAIKAGAAGYLVKTSTPEQIIDAVNKACSGGKYITQSVAEKLATSYRSDGDRDPHELLSNREYEIFRLIVNGLRISTIAENLNLSVKTVSTHRSKILKKMNLKSNADLIYYAMEYGLTDYPQQTV